MSSYPYMRKIIASSLAAPSLLIAALWTLSVAGIAAAAPSPALSLAPCKVAGIEREVRCGRFEVYEDREKAAGRKISLRVVVVPATGPSREPDPVFVFEGGPGESAVENASGEMRAGAELNRKRDFVFVDVRGTGDSNALKCKALQGHQGVLGYMESFLPVPGVRACRQELEGRANLALYTTALAVDDVDDVRAALGYDRINLEGGSYGSFAALNYMRRHPEHVRTAVIQGIVPPDTRMPLHFARYAQTALDQVIAACARDADCHAAFPDPAGDIRDVLAKLEKHPAEVMVKDSRTGNPVKVVLGRSAAAQTFRYMLYVSNMAAQIPLQAHLAAKGDFSMLAESAYMFGNFVTSSSDGFYLSVTCAEDVPRFELPEAEKEARGTFLGDFRSRAQKAACAEWPQGKPPAGFTEPVRSDAPTLLMSGERDPVTPASSGELAARTLPHGKHIVVPGGGHGYDGEKGLDCLDRIATAFVERGSEKDLDTGCVASIQPVAFALRDDRAPEVKLSEAELDRFVGVYAAPNGHELTIRREGANLHAAMGEDEDSLLTPIGPARFRLEGAPPGFFLEFQSDGGGVTGLRMEEGPNDSETMKRKR